MDWIWSGILLAILALVIGCAEMVRHKLNFSVNLTRKLVHVLTGVLIAIAPFLLVRPDPLLLVAAIFAVLNFIAIRRGWMPGMHGTRTLSYGTVFYPISFVILLLLLWNHHRPILVIAVLIMSLADALAALVGENIKNPTQYQFSGCAGSPGWGKYQKSDPVSIFRGEKIDSGIRGNVAGDAGDNLAGAEVFPLGSALWIDGHNAVVVDRHYCCDCGDRL